MLGENTIAVRTKAMKCLSEVVAVDPSILARVRMKYPLCIYIRSVTLKRNPYVLFWICFSVLFSRICSEVFMDG